MFVSHAPRQHSPRHLDPLPVDRSDAGRSASRHSARRVQPVDSQITSERTMHSNADSVAPLPTPSGPRHNMSDWPPGQHSVTGHGGASVGQLSRPDTSATTKSTYLLELEEQMAEKKLREVCTGCDMAASAIYILPDLVFAD